MGRMILNVLIWISLITVILSACMVDSESLIPAYICGVSMLTLMVSGWTREWLYGSYTN